MVTLCSHGLGPCSGGFLVALGVTLGGLVALVPHPVGISDKECNKTLCVSTYFRDVESRQKMFKEFLTCTDPAVLSSQYDIFLLTQDG